MTDVSEQPDEGDLSELGGGGHTHLGGVTFMDGIGGKVAPGTPTASVTGSQAPGGPQTTEPAAINAQGNFLELATPLYDISAVACSWQYTPEGRQEFGAPGGSAEMGPLNPGMNNLTLQLGQSGNQVQTNWQQSP